MSELDPTGHRLSSEERQGEIVQQAIKLAATQPPERITQERP